mgnify:CR=1 FL=1
MDSPMVAQFEIVSTSDKKGLTEGLVEYLKEVGFVRELRIA